MKKTELILIGLVFLATIMKVLELPSSGPFLILFYFSLSIIYFHFGFALFNNIEFRKILKKESYKGVSTSRIIGAIGTGLALSISTMGILFNLQSYPGSYPMLILGFVSLAIVMPIALIKSRTNTGQFYPDILKRVTVFGALVITLLALPSENENYEIKENDSVADFLARNNEYQKARVAEHLRIFEIQAIINPPKMKKEYSNFKGFDSNIQNLIERLESPQFELSKDDSISQKATSLFSTIIHKINEDDKEDLAYFENNLFIQWDDMELLKSKPFRLQLVNTLLNSEVYLINYIISARQFEFTEMSPLIETIEPGKFRLTLAAYDTDINAKLFLGQYDSTITNGNTQFTPREGMEEIHFENGFVYINTNQQKLIGLIKYKERRSDVNHFWPIKKDINKR